MVYYGVTSAAKSEWTRAGRKPWPENLGPLEDVPKRFPKRGASADAVRLAELARPLGIEFLATKSADDVHEAIGKFVGAEHVRDVAEIAAPPSPVAEYVEKHAPHIDAVRDHLLQSREIAWAVDLGKTFNAPIPNIVAHLRLTRLLIARALIRSRGGDAGAWDDLRAAYVLERSLHPRPELVPQVVALSMARSINAAAWKMPLPAPAWLAEMQAVDHRALILRGMQVDTWVVWRNVPDELPMAGMRSYLYASMANMALHQHESAVELVQVQSCGFDGKAFDQQREKEIARWNTPGQITIMGGGDLWSRMLRYGAEKEGTANAMRVRAGQSAIKESRCADGTWSYDAGRVSFLPAIRKSAPVEMPLSLAVTAPPALAE